MQKVKEINQPVKEKTKGEQINLQNEWLIIAILGPMHACTKGPCSASCDRCLLAILCRLGVMGIICGLVRSVVAFVCWCVI